MLQCLGTLPCLSAIFIKGNNFCDFLVTFLVGALSQWGQLLKGKGVKSSGKNLLH